MVSLPVQLDTPPPWAMRILSLLFGAGVLLAILVQAGTSWRVYEFRANIEPAFASTGLLVERQRFADWTVGPGSAAARAAGVQQRSIIERVGTTEVPRSATYTDVGLLLAGADGSPVSVRLRNGAEVRDVPLVRSAENRSEAFGAGRRTYYIATQYIDVILAIFIIVAAVTLRLRRFDEPVAIIFSFALLFFAMLGTWRFWAWLDLQPMIFVIEAVWLGLALFALPAFPSGRFVPAWSRWFLLAGPAAAILLAVPTLPAEVAQLIRTAMICAVLMCVILRFRRTHGLERQQMKWAMLAFGMGIVFYGLGEGFIYWRAELDLPRHIDAWFQYGGYILSRLAFVVMALGTLVSLLDYRLNDADAAIGRSTGYAVITTVVAVVWAMSTVWINKAITWVTGGGNAAMATAISTVVALLILTPARARVMTWTEERFQRELVRLKALPRRIARWQHDDKPEQVASQALEAVVDGVNALRAALISGTDREGAEILARCNIEEEEVVRQLGERRPVERSADHFPLRLPVEDHLGVVATLLLGGRSDGASYSKEERAAIRAITEPLADALRASQRNADFGGAIAELKARMQELEQAAAPPAPPPPEMRLAK